MALTLINRAGRTVGFTGTINSKNPSFLDSGSWKGAYSSRITVPAGTWLLNAALEGDGQFRAYVEGRGEIITNANSVSRVLQFDTPTDLYFEVANWTLEKDRKLLVTLTEAPPCVIAFWRVWGWHRGAKEDQPAQRLRRRLVCADHLRDRVPYSDQFSTQGVAGTARTVQAETHPDIFQQVRQRRRTPVGCCGLLPRRLPGQCVPDHELASRLIPAGGEGRGA